jgi:hypothetical protein
MRAEQRFLDGDVRQRIERRIREKWHLRVIMQHSLLSKERLISTARLLNDVGDNAAHVTTGRISKSLHAFLTQLETARGIMEWLLDLATDTQRRGLSAALNLEDFHIAAVAGHVPEIADRA